MKSVGGEQHITIVAIYSKFRKLVTVTATVSIRTYRKPAKCKYNMMEKLNECLLSYFGSRNSSFE